MDDPQQTGPKYLVSYDLHGADPDYSRVGAILKRWDATRILGSVWVVQSTSDAATLRIELLAVMATGSAKDDDNDRLLVVHVGVDAKWFNLFCDDAEAKALFDGF